MLLKVLLLRLLAARSFAGALALLATFALPVAALLEVVGIPLLIVLGVVAVPLGLVLAVVGLPILLVVAGVALILALIGPLLALGVLAIKWVLPIVLIVWLVRRLLGDDGEPKPADTVGSAI